MKKRLLILAAVCLFALSSCAAMLERSYSSVSAHVDNPTTAEDPSVLRVENYRELVSAVLYLVSQGAEEGTIRLYDYGGDVSADLANACAEVATQDPLGAYAVDYIRHESVKVVSYYEATLTIGYRRTVEQMRSMVNVTGTGAIRTQLREALSDFESETVFRVTYFSGDEASIAELLRETYEEDLTTALGFPETAINLYPETGRERVVEVLLIWPESAEALAAKRDRLGRLASSFGVRCAQLSPAEAALAAAQELNATAVYEPITRGGDTAYSALVGGRADEYGLAWGYALLCRQCGLAPTLVEGIRREASPEEPIPSEEGESAEDTSPALAETGALLVETPLAGGELYFLPAENDGRLYTAQELFDLGYRWEGGPAEPEPEETAVETLGEEAVETTPAETQGG